jgi:hypothetical protein
LPSATIAFDKPDETWAKYNLYQMPITIAAQSTGYKAILRTTAEKAGLVAITHASYKLYPHEEALAMADDLARTVNAKPIGRVPNAGHVILQGRATGDQGRREHITASTAGNRMNAFYLLEQEHKVTNEKGDVVQVGFSIHNAIDGSRTFGADGFTFRLVCTNGAIIRDKSIAWLRFVHSKNMDVSRQNMTTSLSQLVERTKYLVTVYQQWSKLELEKKIAEQLVQRIPDKYLPDFIETEKDKFSRIIGKHSIWDTYNAITNPLWHGKGEMVYKENLYEKLHRTLVPLARVA